MALGTRRKAAQRLSVNPVSLPSGSLQDFAGSVAPEGWVMCDGGEYSRTEQAALFAVIGTTYGVGDGSTTFNVPDERGQFRRGLDDMGTAAGAAGIDSGRALGSNQAHATAKNGLSASTTASQDSHYHIDGLGAEPSTNTRYGLETGLPNNSYHNDYGATGVSLNYSRSAKTSSSTPAITASTTITGDLETRPVNNAYNVIIKL